MKIQRIIIPLLVVLSMLFMGLECYVEPSSVEVKIISTGDDFTGYYIADAGSIVTISGGTADGTLYVYERTINMDTSIRVHAACDSSSGSSIQILIYRDDQLVASDEDTDEYSSIPSITLDYAYDDDSDS